MATIYETITEKMKAAMIKKDAAALSALRGLKTALQNAQIQKGNVHELLSEREAQSVVRKQMKQRTDAIALYEKAGRSELKQKEEEEMNILASFLPQEMTTEEVAAAVQEVMSELGACSKKDMGRVMKAVQERTEGRAPGKLLSQMVSAKLS